MDWASGLAWVLLPIAFWGFKRFNGFNNSIGLLEFGGMQGYKETIKKIYRLPSTGVNCHISNTSGLLLLFTSLSVTTFNGDIQIVPLSKKEEEEEAKGLEKDGEHSSNEGGPLIMINIHTHRPSKESQPIIISMKNADGGIEVTTAKPASWGLTNSIGYAAHIEVKVSQKQGVFHKVELKLDNGSIHFTCPSLRILDTFCKADNGSISISAKCKNLVRLISDNGSLKLISDRLPMDTILKTSNGSIKTWLPPPGTKKQHRDALKFHLHTSNGKVYTDMKHSVLLPKGKKKNQLTGLVDSVANQNLESVAPEASVVKQLSLKTSNGDAHLISWVR